MKTILRVFIVTILFIGISKPAIAQEDEQRFLQGMMKEEGEGNLQGAINIYTQLANDNSATRTVRAKALLQMGICYEKLGQEKATTAYQKLIAEYSDQKDLIAVAKMKLSLLKKSSPTLKPQGIVIQELKKGIDGVLFDVSHDGRYYGYLGWKGRWDNELLRYDLLTGKEDSITTENIDSYDSPHKYFPWSTIWSHDGKKVAYVIAYTNVDRKDLRISDSDGQNEQILLTTRKNSILNYEKGEINDADFNTGRLRDVYSFSPDGKKLLFTRNRMVGESTNLELVEMTLHNKEVRVLKNIIEKSGSSVTYGFKYSPNGQYIAYSNFSEDTKSTDIFAYDIENNIRLRITNESFNESSPFWSPDGEKIGFISDRFVSMDLMAIDVSNGKVIGSPIVIKKELGRGLNIHGIDKEGAIYFTINNTKSDLFTVDLNKNLDFIPESLHRISLPTFKYNVDFARYSKDGRYISYHTPFSETFRGYSGVDSDAKFDPALGNKYAIFIYDTQTQKSKFLDIELFQNHWPRANMWMVPEWSYHGYKLIVNGRNKNYDGGFFEIDVESEKVTPILTLPDSKHTDMKLVGQYMRYSKKPDIIYYSSLGWKNAMMYNMKTHEKKTIATIEDGFWFEGFSDNEETIVRATNRFGVFEYDINTHKIKTLREGGYPHSSFPIPSVNKSNSFVISNKLEDGKSVLGIEVMDENRKPIKFLNPNYLFPDNQINIIEKHPTRDQFLILVKHNPGKSIYKLSNVFK